MRKLLIAILLVALASPALAYQIELPGEGNSLNLYGQVRVQSWYQGVNDWSKGQATTKEDFVYGIQSNSRVGFDINIGQFFGKMETNFNGDGEATNRLGFRLLYSGYKFNHGGTLTVGRMFILGETSLAFDALYATDSGMAGYGTILSYRRTAIKYGIAGFEIGVFQTTNYGNDSNFGTESDAPINVNGNRVSYPIASTMSITDYYPEVQVAYNAKFSDIMASKLFVTWTAFDVQNRMEVNIGPITVVDTQKEAINQITAGLVLKPQLGPLAISFSAIYAYNGNLMDRVKHGGSSIIGFASFDEIKVENTGPLYGDKWTGLLANHTYGVALQATYAVNAMMSARIGGGWQSTSSEGLQYMGLVDGKKIKSLDSFSVYVNAPIKLGPYITAIPTVGYFAESQSNGEFKGKGTLIAGAQFRAIF